MDKVRLCDLRLWETHEYKGLPVMKDVMIDTLKDFKTFEIRDDDIFVVTYPRSGTTWTQEITSCILHEGNMDVINATNTIERVPFIEATFGSAVYDDLPRTDKLVHEMPKTFPRLIKSHLQGEFLPPQIWEKKAKIIYILRDPKAVFTSYYYLHRLFEPEREFTLEELFERFYTGNIAFGKWWDHCLYFWKRRNEDHILLLRYEEMNKDLGGTVKKISEFVGKSLSAEILDVITDHCTFENMKKNPAANPDAFLDILRKDVKAKEGTSFLREGRVESWKYLLTVAQAEALDALCKEKMAEAGLFFD